MIFRQNSHKTGNWGRKTTLSSRSGTDRRLPHKKLGLELLEDRRLLSVGPPPLACFDVSPALFVENRGQWVDSSIRFLHQGDGANVAMTDAGPVFHVFRTQDNLAPVPPPPLEDWLGEEPGMRPAPTETLRFSASFAGANLTAPVGLQQAETQFNFFVGEQSNWHFAVPGYAAVAYENLYPGIELKTWGQRDSLKYEFHVAPNADYRQIQIHYSGIEGLSLADNGSLRIDLGSGWGELTDDAPYIYQDIGGHRMEVAGKFELIDSHTYAFTVTGAYDATRELVIDPDLAWAAYLGGSGSDYGYGISVDAAGNAYVTGQTASTNFSGGNNSYSGGSYDAYVAKVSASGTLAWAAYLGGSGDDYGYGISVDPTGNAFITGNTTSQDFSAANNDYIAGTSDAFAAKISAAGAIVWATYLGGGRVETGYSISLDAAGNVFVTGSTTSTNFVGAINGAKGGNSDAFLAKISSNGTLAWATYLGGSGTDVARGISTDSAGNAFITGNTTSTSLYRVNNSFRGGSFDAFAMQISTAGAVVWATFLGGSGDDFGYGISAGAMGNVFVAGNTSSTDFTGKNNIYKGGNHDAFAVKLSNAGTLAWAAYLGGSAEDVGYGISVDAADNAFVTGDTSSANFSGANNAFKGGGYDAFTAKISAAGTPRWATYLGGNYIDAGRSVFLDASGVIYVAGQTTSTNLPGAINTTKGSQDAYVVKIYDRSQTPIAPALVAASDSGINNSDKITNCDNSNVGTTLQFLVGNTIVGAVVTVYADGIAIGTATATDTTTTITTNGTLDLVDGAHAITARQIETGQPESPDSPILNISIDTQAPAIPAAPDLQAASDRGFSDSDNITNDNTPTFDIPAAPYFRFYRNDACISGQYETGSSYTAAAQADGTHNYTIAAVDAAGNESAQSGILMVTFDTVAPTVVIERTKGQIDPTYDSPINLTASFSETVFDFATGDATASGTAAATSAAVRGSGKDYVVAISGMASNGTVIVSSPAAVAHDIAGNPSAASTDTNNIVTYNTTIRIWDGGGPDNNWSTAENWVGDVTPSPGDNLVFRADAAQFDNVNDFPAGTQFSSIVVSGGSYHFQNSAIRSPVVAVRGNTALSIASIVCDTLIIGTSITPGQTRTWSGGGPDNNWSTAENWIGDAVPLPGDKLVFPTGAFRTENINDFPQDTFFSSIAVVGGNYRIQSSAIHSTTVEVRGNTVLTAASITCDTLTIGTRSTPPKAAVAESANAPTTVPALPSITCDTSVPPAQAAGTAVSQNEVRVLAADIDYCLSELVRSQEIEAPAASPGDAPGNPSARDKTDSPRPARQEPRPPANSLEKLRSTHDRIYEHADELFTNIEKRFPDVPDREKWSQEDSFADLKKMIETMSQVEDDLKAARYQNALRQRPVLLEKLDNVKQYLNGEFQVHRDQTSHVPVEIQKEILNSLQDPSPLGWEDLNRQYFEHLSGE